MSKTSINQTQINYVWSQQWHYFADAGCMVNESPNSQLLQELCKIEDTRVLENILTTDSSNDSDPNKETLLSWMKALHGGRNPHSSWIKWDPALKLGVRTVPDFHFEYTIEHEGGNERVVITQDNLWNGNHGREMIITPYAAYLIWPFASDRCNRTRLRDIVAQKGIQIKPLTIRKQGQQGGQGENVYQYDPERDLLAMNGLCFIDNKIISRSPGNGDRAGRNAIRRRRQKYDACNKPAHECKEEKRKGMQRELWDASRRLQYVLTLPNMDLDRENTKTENTELAATQTGELLLKMGIEGAIENKDTIDLLTRDWPCGNLKDIVGSGIGCP